MLDWFDFLYSLAEQVGDRPLRLDEVNFWSPRSSTPITRLAPGEPVFFRLGAPRREIAGYGFFASHQAMHVNLAWVCFRDKNGAATQASFGRMVGRPENSQWYEPFGCMILRDAVFWPRHRRIPWGESRGYAVSGVQRGRLDGSSENVALLMERIREDGVSTPAELAPEFSLVRTDERVLVEAESVRREGQGTFRTRLLEEYEGQCAVTGEHTEPVLQAAHIQRYLGPASNHVQNGILLTSEFHTLFDRGLVTVDPPTQAKPDAYVLRVSRLLQERWNNGRRYREYQDRPLRIPSRIAARPSAQALEWHRAHVFERVA